MANNELEKRLWDAADQLRANSALTSQEYSRPVLGLIFLKYAGHRFTEAEKVIAKESSSKRRTIGKLDYQDKGVVRSKNIIGDLGEYLAIEHYCSTPNLPKLQQAPPNTQNVDALSTKGERYSIKATSSKLTSVFYGLNPPKSNEPER